MSGDRDKDIFLALSLDDRLRISFSGQRYYQLINIIVMAEGETETISADLVPTDFDGCLPVGLPGSEEELDYRDWLMDNGMNDPLWDEVALPYYEAIIAFSKTDKLYRMRLKAIITHRTRRYQRVKLELA